jgi:hypothetical protein
MSKRVCVIGAGPSGLAAAKNCIEAGLECVVFEKNDRVGGNWVFNAKTGHSSVYENTHIISSKIWSEYEDFPMPDSYPDYPNHRQRQAYFAAYATYFHVMESIRFETTVQHAVKRPAGGWDLTIRAADGRESHDSFDVLMVANGHHWDPKLPDYEGTFDGRLMHSHDFKGVTEDWRGKNVLVIGGGNSACDVAVEAARVAGRVCLSMRSPQWFLPKFMFGLPVDVMASSARWLPRKVMQTVFTRLLRVLQGPYSRYGLPENTRPVLSQHPTLNSDLLDYIRHGRVEPRPAIRRLAGREVEFVDGRREPFDIVCACTGFWITFPFFDEAFLTFKHAAKVPLFRKMMHADHRDLYFIGLFQPLGCIWPLADLQARLACEEIRGTYARPPNLHAAIAREMDHPHYDFAGGSRHSTEVDYLGLREELRAELKRAQVEIGEAPALTTRRLARTALSEPSRAHPPHRG